MAWYSIKICAWFLAALFCHELGHVLALVYYHVPIRRVSIGISGAVIHHDLCTYRTEFVCALSGPAAGFLLCLIVCRRCPELAVISCGLSFVNLLPLYPLDGGRILRSVLLQRFNEAFVMRVLKYVTAAVCCILMTAACCVTATLQMGIWPIFAVLAILWRVGSAVWSEK